MLYKKLYCLIIFCLVCYTKSNAQIIPTNGGVPNVITLAPIPAGYSNANSKINYVRTWEPWKPINDPSIVPSQTVADVKSTTAYVDGLGRVIQTVTKQISPLQKDMVSYSTYDEFGREALKYLPYTSTGTDGSFKSNPFTEQKTYYSTGALNNNQYSGELVYYSRSAFEPAPLGRIDTALAPGNSWGGNNRGVRMQYLLNTVSDSVRLWVIADAAGSIPTTTATYSLGLLFKTISIDEQNNKVVEYKDKQGKVILKKVQLANSPANGHSGWLCTYYIYDNYGLLRLVIQPKGVELMNNASNWSISSFTNLFDEQCFRYEYDNRNRMIIKKVPGAGEVWMVYDKLDRLVLTQDNLLRTQGKWLYTQYDAQERPYSSGLWTNANNRSYHQGLADASTNYPSLSGTWEELTHTYFDDYSWSGSRAFDASYVGNLNAGSNPYSETVTPTNQTYGIVTGTKIKVLGTSNTWITSSMYYDEKGRVIQVLTDNSNGGLDVTTTQYDFTGKILSSYLHHRNPSSVLTPEVKVLSKMLYDQAGRLTKLWKQLNNSGTDKLILENSYDEIGQLKSKNIGVKPGTSSTPLESLAYEYNIRGWMKSINKDYVNASSNTNFFGQSLSYDYGFTASQYNGNISGLQWRSKGDGEQRAYGFGYDNVNRLLKADFTQNNSGWNTSAGIDFSMKMGDGTDPNSAYDANGNIKKMWQKGWRLGGSFTVDSLIYQYYSNMNKLKWVRDGANDVTTKLGDFKEPSQNNLDNLNSDLADYTYDGNGNMIADNNKSISSITYNHLNLPSLITVAGKGSIAYTYDAGGNKLKKVTTEGTKITTTTYLSGFVYQRTSTIGSTADTLQFFGHEEGRVRYTPPVGATAAKFSYDYMVKDHLGNVRVLLTEETQQDVYVAATLEGSLSVTTDAIYKENDYFTINSAFVVNSTVATGITAYQNNNGNPPYNTNPNGNPTANSAKIYQTNSNTNKTGLGITLKVMAGDTINIFGKSYYFQSGNIAGSSSAVQVVDILSAFAGTTTMAGKGLTGSGLNAIPQIASGVGALLSSQPAQSGSTPKAYINWIFFDERFNYAGGGFDRVGSSGTVKSHNNSTIPAIVVPKSGYIFVYCSNESPINVFFDNLQLIQSRGPILEETHYYPFGLVMAGISSKAGGKIQNRYRFISKEEQCQEFSDGSGLEIFDFGKRALDMQIGRWNVIDILCDISRKWSPYTFAMDNPIVLVDPDGMAVKAINGGFSFSGEDAVFAFGVLQSTYKNKQGKDDNKYIGSVGIITFGKEKVWGEAMKALIPEAIIENVPGGSNQGGYDDFYSALKKISDQSPNGIGFLAIFSHGAMDNNQNRNTYGEGMIFANFELNPTASNVYTSDLTRLGQSVQSGLVNFATYAVIYLGACNASTVYKSNNYPDGRSFAMELARVTGAYVYGAKDSHMNPSSTVATNTTFGATDKGGQLMINYWYPGSPTGASVPAISRSVNVAKWARWYLNLGY